MTVRFPNFWKESTFAADTANLAKIREFVRDVVEGQIYTTTRVSEDTISDVVLAVDEACANLIHHALASDASRVIRVFVYVDDFSLDVRISDDGPSFDPSVAPLPNMEQYMQQLRSGGLGISIIRRLMDRVEYTPSGPNRPLNSLLLSKNR